MPLEKKVRVSTHQSATKRSQQDSDSDSDSGPEDRNPVPSKKEKKEKTSHGAQKGGPAIESGEPTWELGQNKKVKVNKI